MTHSIVHLVTSLVILLAVTSAKDQGRWSRQISTYTADISDWVPLKGPVERDPEPLPPIKRQAVAEPRILSEPFPGLSRPTGFSADMFPARNFYNSPANRQLYLQSVPSVPSAPQNFLTEQGFGQSIRFGLSQPNFPLNQGFVSHQFGYDGLSPIKSRPLPQPIPPSPINFPKPAQQHLPVPSQIKYNIPKKPEVPKYIDGYRAENTSNDFGLNKKPVSLQKMNYDMNVKAEHAGLPKVEKEEVQLLYVPLESLNRGQYNFRNPLGAPQLVNTELYSGQKPFKQMPLESQVPIQKPFNNLPAQDYYKNYNSQRKDIDQVPKYSTIQNPFPTALPTTPKPKKLKPHQPPLAIFITEEASKNNQIKVGDVLGSLKNADSIAVLDSVNPLNAPKVFIGPSSLQPPERYVRFELPYLSNIEHSDKKLRQLPFFVAPLSYNTPQGFAKIPFPSPHVGSVVINSQIKEPSNQAPQIENVKPNYFAGVYRQEPVTQKPMISFYSTNPPQNKPNYQSNQNYYSFEPQTVSTIRPAKESEIIAHQKPGSYFMGDLGTQYELTNYQQQAPVQQYNPQKRVETTTTPRPTVSTTPKPHTNFPKQLLETHNPYSINHAFHFSTPLDYHNYFEEVKEVATPGTEINPPHTPTPSQVTSRVPPRVEEVTEKQYNEQSPYIQNYNPQIHYESEGQNPRYPEYNANNYPTKQESDDSFKPLSNDNTQQVNNNPEYTIVNQDSQGQVDKETVTDNLKPTVYEVENANNENTQFESSYDSDENKTSTTTSTTRRTPLRTRGRPRYTTTPRTSSESGEYTTRTATRKPLRERRPLPNRSRYEPNKITTEKPTRKPIDYSGESTTKSTSRTRSRGRVQFKPTESDEVYKKKSGNKDQDLAYQRDILHQNYPVTLMERMSTVDIEAITESNFKSSSNRYNEPATESYDTENAYTNEKASVSQYDHDSDVNDDIPVYPTRTTLSQTETSYVPKLSTRNEEYVHNTRYPADHIAQTTERDEDSYPRQTTSFQRDATESDYVTEPTVSISDEKGLSYSSNKEYSNEETTITPDETTRVSEEEQEEENVVQTTPSYNRVRVRPGVIRQYHQPSTESPKTKADRRRPVTYRPAFDRRRTTMRIDEIEADLKTKQVHSRPDQEYRHPVYKPEPTTESPSTVEASTKRGQFRRRRPTYTHTTTSTESSATRKYNYDANRNRLRGRRPTTEKPTDKPEVQTDSPTTTVRPVYNRYSHRPRLSERYNKKPEQEENEDQDSNYSYNRPKYVDPSNDQWSPKINSESFKPYNPNNIEDDVKVATTERRSDRLELDIITARNEYEDMLISVTPASNNRNNKKIPEIPPTLEALVEQSKVTKSEAGDKMSTFESMLEEVMKSLEEQDENEYSSNVMKHKGGEIGEIPPERIISSGDGYNGKTTPLQHETTTPETYEAETTTAVSNEEETDKKHRRGFWKKVKVRPVTTESIEVAESQYYTSTVNKLGQPMKQEKTKKEKPKSSATTYKPSFQFISDMFGGDYEELTPSFDISKVKQEDTTDRDIQTEKVKPEDLDLGTGSPDPTIDDFYTTTEVTTVKSENPYSFMDYLFGVTSEDDKEKEQRNDTIEITTEESKNKIVTTEVSFIPDEITEDEKREANTESPKVEVSSSSSYMNPANVVSTSMSTEVSHETEICFRGKCIKTSKTVL